MPKKDLECLGGFWDSTGRHSSRLDTSAAKKHRAQLESDFDMSRVVVVGMRGLSTDSNEGVASLVEHLRDKLRNQGIPDRNFYSTKWHHSDSGSEPETHRHWQEVTERSSKPILYIIGHSLGGWSAARLANEAHEAGAEVRYVALIDARYNITTPGDPFKIHADYVANW